MNADVKMFHKLGERLGLVDIAAKVERTIAQLATCSIEITAEDRDPAIFAEKTMDQSLAECSRCPGNAD
jgi:hypothetical protein